MKHVTRIGVTARGMSRVRSAMVRVLTLRLWLIMLGCLVVGPPLAEAATGDDPPARLDDVRSRGDGELYFGPVREYHSSGFLEGKDGQSKLEFHAIEVSRTVYDHLQTRNRFVDKEVRAAALVTEHGVIPLIGVFDTSDQFVELGLVIDSGSVDADWESVIGAARKVCMAGGRPIDRIPSLILRSGGREFDIWISAESEASLGLDEREAGALSLEMKPMDASPTEQPRWIRRTWVGPLHNEADDTVVRLETVLQEPTKASSVSNGSPGFSIGVLSIRFRSRRLDGAVPDDCPWQTRAQFVHTLQDLDSAGVNWFAGQYTPRAEEIVVEATDVRLTAQSFYGWVDAAFGDRDAALDATCPFPEVRHHAVFSPRPGINEGASLIGAVCFIRTDELGRKVVLNADVHRLRIQSSTERATRAMYDISYLNSEGSIDLGDYVVMLREVPANRSGEK